MLSNVSLNVENVLRLLLPMILGYTTSSMCWKGNNKRSAGESVVFRPPSYVFGIVWPILYIMLGVSWILSTQSVGTRTGANRGRGKMVGSSIRSMSEIGYVSISLLLALWIVVYGCRNRKVWGVYVIVLTLGSIIFTMNVVGIYSRLLLTPLLTWLFLALLMNVFEVQNIRR
tara:strand:- start:596 stop:1111 length:516 start_codon:yes stop_codon:yes gene_type:complete